jgi:hypothetical protein
MRGAFLDEGAGHFVHAKERRRVQGIRRSRERTRRLTVTQDQTAHPTRRLRGLHAADAERDEAIGTRGMDFVAGLHNQPQRAERVTLDV